MQTGRDNMRGKSFPTAAADVEEIVARPAPQCVCRRVDPDILRHLKARRAERWPYAIGNKLCESCKKDLKLNKQHYINQETKQEDLNIINKGFISFKV